MTIQLVVHGAAGRMGQRIIALSTEDPRFQLAGAIESSQHPQQGQDVGPIAGVATLGIPLSSRLSFVAGQMVIDFSHPSVLEPLVEAAVQNQVSLVCGTTGLAPRQLDLLEQAGQRIPVLFSPNMSVGVNLLFLLARQVAQTLGDDFDAEVMEIHHRYKKDAPSGTALRLAEHIAEGRDLNLATHGRYSREGNHVERKPGEIGVQSLRGGDIPGEHTAFFCGFGERLELTHRALTRDIFARGALRAAAWLHGKPPGFYHMFHVLGLES